MNEVTQTKYYLTCTLFHGNVVVLCSVHVVQSSCNYNQNISCTACMYNVHIHVCLLQYIHTYTFA